MVCCFALSCWNTCCLEGSICCSKTFYISLAFIVPSKTCKQPIPYALMQTHTISSTMLITHWKFSLLFSLEDKTGCLMSHLTIEHFSTLKQSIWNEPWPTGYDGASGPCLHMASFLRDRALVGICRWQGKLCLPTVVSGSIVMITYNIYIVIKETGQFSSKGIINDFIGNLNRLTVSRRFTEQAV